MTIHIMRTGLRSIMTLCVALAAWRCSDPNGPDPAIGLSLSVTTVAMRQNENQNVDVSITRLNGYDAPVTLSLEGAPAGVTAAFAPVSLSNGRAASTLSLAAAASAPTGPHTLTVRARGGGVADQTATLILTLTPAPAVVPSLSPSSLVVRRGESGTATITIARNGGFTGGVELSAEGVPNGVTASFAPATIPDGATMTTITLAVGSSAETGSFPITVRVRAQGLADQIIVFLLTVQIEPGYTLAVLPSAGAVQPGGSMTLLTSILRTGGFTAPVTLSLEGAPSGVVGTFSINPVTSGTPLTITVAAGAAPGTYHLTVKGSASGVSDRLATFTLELTPVASPGNVSFQFCSVPSPTWVAYQNDEGPWTRVASGANSTYSFSITSRGAIAIVTPRVSGYRLDVIYGTAAELAAIGPNWEFACEVGPGPNPKQLSGTIAGVSAAEAVRIFMGPRLALISGGKTTYTLTNTPDGVLDLVAVRGTSTGFLDFSTNKVILRRGLNPPNGASIPLLDFDAPESVVPTTANLTINGVGAGNDLLSIVDYRTAGRVAIDLTSRLDATAHSYQGIPAAAQSPDDVHELLVIAAPSNPNGTEERWLLSAFHTATDRTVTLGPSLVMPTATAVATVPYARYRLQLPLQNEYAEVAEAFFVQPTRSAALLVTRGYLGGAPPTWDLVVPDLSTAPGFSADWGLRAGVLTNWTADAASGLGLYVDLVDGETTRYAERSSTASLALTRRDRLATRRTGAPLDQLRQR